MSKTIEHFFKPVGSNDSSSSKAVHAAAVLAAQKEKDPSILENKNAKILFIWQFAKILYREHFHAYGIYNLYT